MVKNQQFIEFCDRAGDRVTATLYQDIIEPDERFRGRLRPDLLLRSATNAEAQELARGGGPHARAGGGAPEQQHSTEPACTTPRLLMDVDPSARFRGGGLSA